MILIDFEAGLVVIQGVIPSISFEANMTYLPTILLRRCEPFDVRPDSVIHHLKNFRIDLVWFRILKLRGWDHVLSIIGFELNASFFCFVQVLEKPIMALR